MQDHETLKLAAKTHTSYSHSKTFALILISLLTLFINWPYLLAGFSGDDVIFLNILEENPLPFSRWSGMWSIAASDWSFLDYVWWKDWTSSDGSGFFWRPIPSLIFECFVSVFGDNAFPLHILLILIHAIVGIILYLFVRKLTRQYWLALLAGVFFITCEDHSILLGWITAFTGPLATLFTMLALLIHVHWLQHRRPIFLAVSLLMIAFAMACKESASVTPIIIILLTFFIPTGSVEIHDPGKSFRERMGRFVRDPWSWAPAVVILGAYLIAYRSMGLGTISSLMYISPFTDPIKYLSHLILHLPIMWLGTLSPLSPFFLMFFPSVQWIAAFLGTILLGVWIFALRAFKRNSLIIWASISYMVALLPELATDASERGLYLAMIPASIVLAKLLLTIKSLATHLNLKLLGIHTYTRVVGWLSLMVILIPGIILSLAMPWAYLPSLNGLKKR